MANKILQRRGLKANLPTGSAGELLYATDTRELFVGTGNGNVNMGGSHWYRGTAMSGTSTTANQYSYSACPEVKLDDIYMNTSNDNIYACTTAGKGTNAKWTYQGCIKGATGATGAAGTNGNGISSGVVTYAAGASGVTAPSSWQSSIPSVNQGYYLWTRLVITYTDGTTSTSYSVARQGANGTVTVDSALSASSGNPVKNSVITAELNKKKTITKSFSNWDSSINIPNGQTIIYEGEGVGKTTITLHDTWFTGSGCAIFRNATVHLGGSSDRESTASLIFENCDVFDIISDMSDTAAPFGFELYNGSGDLTFLNSKLYVRDLNSNSPCKNGIYKAGRVVFIGGNVMINSGSELADGFDCNLIYECESYEFIGTNISCSGINNINLVYKGRGSFNGGSIICGNSKHSVCHYNTDITPLSRFVGVYLEYYQTYMNFGAISGCTFNHKAAGSSSANQMILQCTANMTGNHFIGSAAYIDGQNKKHIIDRNLSDNGITTASMASGSVTTNNVTY